MYSAVAKPLIENVVTGYNATVFAYGATGKVQQECNMLSRCNILRTMVGRHAHQNYELSKP